MKKLSKDGNIVFPLGKVIIKVLPLLLFCITNLSSQTLLNNFGISDFVNTHSGYTQFIFLDYNKDGIEDLFLFGNQEKSFVLHEGLKDSTFSNPLRKFFFYPIDDIKWLTKSAEGDDYYIFVSRNKRLIGLVSFTRSYSLQLLHTIEFNSYPSAIEITDLDSDGKNEALIYGNNFNGLIQIKNKGYLLESEPLIERNVFSDLVMLDFNQDETEDIIAIDVLNNIVTFLENTEINGFISSRKIEFEETLYSLQKFDYYNNDFADLAVTKEGGLEIFQGDSVYSFDSSVNYPFLFNPHNFQIADFNSDHKKDFVIINELEDKLVLYSDYETEIVPLNIEFSGIVSFKLIDKNNRRSLVTLSKNGKIQILSNEIRWENTFSLSVGGSPNNIKYFDWNDSLYSYFLINNTIDNSINILRLDTTGNFVDLESYPLLNSFSELEFSQNPKQLIGYSTDNRLLEIISIDRTDRNLYNPKFLYTTAPVNQLIVDNENNIQVLELEQNKLYHETIVHSEEKYFSDEISIIDSSAIASYITASGQIYYWKNNENQYSFNRLIEGESKNLISIIEKDSSDKPNLIIEDLSSNDDFLVTIFSSGRNEVVYLVMGDKIQTFHSQIKLVSDDQFASKNIQFYSSAIGYKSLFVYQPPENKFLIFEFDDLHNLLVIRNTIDAVNINDYFVNNFFGKPYLVYSNNDNNCITFKVLN